MSDQSPIPAAKLAQYDKLIATNPDVTRKGAKTPYTSKNGHMFSFLTNTGTLALRLPPEDREAFLKRYKTTLCEQHGHILKEYVVVPDSLFRKTATLEKLFGLSYSYVSSLKPKRTKRARTKKAVPKQG